MSKIDEIRHNKFLASYDEIIQSIRLTKTQIWNITYLSILAKSAMVLAAYYLNNSDPLKEFNKEIFEISIIIIGLIAIAALMLYNKTLKRYRKATIKGKEIYRAVFKYEGYFDLTKKESGCGRMFFIILHPIIILGAMAIGTYIIKSL